MVNTGGQPEIRQKSVNSGKPTDDTANTKGKPEDPSRTMNTSKEPMGGPINTGGQPSHSKSGNPDLGSSRRARAQNGRSGRRRTPFFDRARGISVIVAVCGFERRCTLVGSSIGLDRIVGEERSRR